MGLTLIEWFAVVGVLLLTASLCAPFFATYRGCGSPTEATAARLRQIGWMVHWYAEEYGAMPDSHESLRGAWPECYYDIVFCLDDAVEPLLGLTPAAEDGATPCIWLANEFNQLEPSRQILAIKRVDFGERRDRIVILFGDWSVKYRTTADLHKILAAVREDDAAREESVVPFTPAPSSGAASPE